MRGKRGKTYPGPLFDWIVTPLIVVGGVLTVVGVLGGWF